MLARLQHEGWHPQFCVDSSYLSDGFSPTDATKIKSEILLVPNVRGPADYESGDGRLDSRAVPRYAPAVVVQATVATPTGW